MHQRILLLLLLLNFTAYFSDLISADPTENGIGTESDSSHTRFETGETRRTLRNDKAADHAEDGVPDEENEERALPSKTRQVQEFVPEEYENYIRLTKGSHDHEEDGASG
ncbi:hypothetical protein GQ600_20744 [Phytophthora cactorum]|nr:hypothetical protein GQ600_20744 [Phytophthora cactorum]